MCNIKKKTKYMKTPRVLVVSVNAFNKGGSNGKVLTEFFQNWDSNCLAQFYTHNETPNFSNCNAYYRVTDKEALKAFLPWVKVGKPLVIDNNGGASRMDSSTKKKSSKNPLTYLLRDIIWNSCCWRSKSFWCWIDNFKPDIIVTMAGASSFIHKIAIDISNHCNVPLLVYNTENYYFKEYNYLKGRGWGWLYPIYRMECVRMFRKLMMRSSREIYNNKKLDDLYSQEFGRHGTVIYQASNLNVMDNPPSNKPLRFTYAGNLGINRHKALIEIGHALQSISKDYFLDVYGRASEDVEEQLQRSEGIRYHGLVAYNDVLQVMEQSNFMVHAESFEPFWIKDLSTAFSTKLSDILKAGKCLILYADSSLACSQYVIDNDCGCVITNQIELEHRIKELIASPELQNHYKKNAIVVSQRDMDSLKTSNTFLGIIQAVVQDSK